MIGPGGARAGTRGARMRRDRLIARGREAHLPAAAPDPQGLPGQPERGRVEGLLEDHLAIAMEGGTLPHGQAIGHRGQGPELGPLTRRKAAERGRLRRPMEPLPRRRQAPLARLGVSLGEERRGPTAQEVPSDIADTASRDLAVVLGGAGPAGGQPKAVMLGTPPVGAPDLGVVEAGSTIPAFRLSSTTRWRTPRRRSRHGHGAPSRSGGFGRTQTPHADAGCRPASSQRPRSCARPRSPDRPCDPRRHNQPALHSPARVPRAPCVSDYVKLPTCDA
jgi:hypothetical protein